MTILDIKFANNLNFKYIHDLIMEFDAREICFHEDFDDVDLNQMFTIAHWIQLLSPDIYMTYQTFREEYPLDELSPKLSLREIPFDCVILKNKLYTL